MAQVTSLADARLARQSRTGTEAKSISDDELALGVKNGDGRLAAHLYRRLEPIVRRALRRLAGGNGADLDDLVQVAFERIIVSLKKGSFHLGSNLEAWSTVIATRAGMDHLRTVYRRQKLFSFGETKAEATVEAAGSASLEIVEVRKALAHLKPDHAEVLVLHDALGYELREIAELLNISVSAAQSRLVRTRKDLLSRLKKQEGNLV